MSTIKKEKAALIDKIREKVPACGYYNIPEKDRPKLYCHYIGGFTDSKVVVNFNGRKGPNGCTLPIESLRLDQLKGLLESIE